MKLQRTFLSEDCPHGAERLLKLHATKTEQFLKQLGKKCPGRNNRGIVAGEAIGSHIVGLHRDLKGVGRARYFLKMGQALRQCRITVFGFDQKPGLSIAKNHKVHLALLEVADVAQFKLLN